MSGNVWMFSDEIDDEDLEFMSHDYVTYNMACEYYRLGMKPVIRMAHEAGAVYKIGKKVLIRRSIFEAYQIFTTDNMLWTGGNGTGLSYCLKYADDSTDENPVVLAKGVDENGKEFEQRIYINDVKRK